MTKPTDLVQGTLDLLIMRTIATEELHGWAIAQRIQLLSNDVLQVNQGSLYPALQRLERQGWITADWGVSENNRRARFYRLTPPGHKRLEQERADWDRLSAAISLVMRTAEPQGARGANSLSDRRAVSRALPKPAGRHRPRR